MLRPRKKPSKQKLKAFRRKNPTTSFVDRAFPKFLDKNPVFVNFDKKNVVFVNVVEISPKA